MNNSSFTFRPIGLIHSCFKQKFGIPRQAGLIPELKSMLEILPPWSERPEGFAELSGFSHLWILFVFHALPMVGELEKQGMTVRPPRLGGNKRVGVFASRSPYRPNPIGLSVVKLERLENAAGKILLHLRGGDFLDQTPVLDIKPYISYADSVPGASLGWLPEEQTLGRVEVSVVEFSERALEVLKEKAKELPDLQVIIEKLVLQDPRPAYIHDHPESFAFALYDLDVHFKILGDRAIVEQIIKLS